MLICGLFSTFLSGMPLSFAPFVGILAVILGSILVHNVNNMSPATGAWVGHCYRFSIAVLVFAGLTSSYFLVFLFRPRLLTLSRLFSSDCSRQLRLGHRPIRNRQQWRQQRVWLLRLLLPNIKKLFLFFDQLDRRLLTRAILRPRPQFNHHDFLGQGLCASLCNSQSGQDGIVCHPCAWRLPDGPVDECATRANAKPTADPSTSIAFQPAVQPSVGGSFSRHSTSFARGHRGRQPHAQ